MTARLGLGLAALGLAAGLVLGTADAVAVGVKGTAATGDVADLASGWPHATTISRSAIRRRRMQQ